MATFESEDFTEMWGKDDDKAKTRLAGLELEVVREDESTTDEDIDDLLYDLDSLANWGIDGQDIEIVTNPMSLTLVNDSPELLGDIDSKFVSMNIGTASSSGTHINISKLEGDSKHTYKNLLWLAVAFSTQMEKIFGRSTHWSRNPINDFITVRNYRNDINTSLAKTLFNLYFDEKDIDEGQSSINILMYRNLKSYSIIEKPNRYEFRGGKSSVDSREWIAWIEFCTAMVEAAASDNIENLRFSDLVQGECINHYLKEVVNKNSSRKISAKEMTRRAGNIITITASNESKVY